MFADSFHKLHTRFLTFPILFILQQCWAVASFIIVFGGFGLRSKLIDLSHSHHYLQSFLHLALPFPKLPNLHEPALNMLCYLLQFGSDVPNFAL